jgi:hypothetical protein
MCAAMVSVGDTPLAAGAGAEHGPGVRALAAPVACPSCWIPAQVASFQWQLSGTVDASINAQVYDIDMFDNSSSLVTALHSAGRHVICYIDAGTWENFRPDKNQFPPSVLGQSNGWPGERWLDIRNLPVLEPIMSARLDLCQTKGFDAVEFDNVDGYSNNTGFPLTAQDQLAYNTWLANAAHTRGLSVALKNDPEQVPSLLPYFDFELDEQCFQYHECRRFIPFVTAGKAVFEVEYKPDTSQFCSRANSMNFNAMKKKLNLGVWRRTCR